MPRWPAVVAATVAVLLCTRCSAARLDMGADISNFARIGRTERQDEALQRRQERKSEERRALLPSAGPGEAEEAPEGASRSWRRKAAQAGPGIAAAGAITEESFGHKVIDNVRDAIVAWKMSTLDRALRTLAKASKATRSVVALANPSSGGNQGKAFLSAMEKDFRWVTAVQLPPDDTSKQSIVQIIADGWGKKGTSMNAARLICAGGDGTIGWCLSIVVNLLLKLGGGSNGDNADVATALMLRRPGFAKFLPTFVMCPLGTGNDLSRSIGWGSAFPTLKEWMKTFKATSTFSYFDIWRARWHPGGQCKAEEDLINARLDPEGLMLMFLYASTGWDAVAAAKFARTSVEGSVGQWINKGKHIKNAGFTIKDVRRSDSGLRCPIGCTDPNPNVNEGGNFGMSNTPSMYSGSFPWGLLNKAKQNNTAWKQSKVYDKKLELFKTKEALFGQLSRLQAAPLGLSAHLTRVGQAAKVLLTWPANPGRLFQVDGEGGIKCDGAGGLLLVPGGQIRMLVGPFRKKHFQECTEGGASKNESPEA